MEDYKKITMDSYQKNARLFADYFKTNAVFPSRRTEFSKFVNLLSGNKILDVGCGGGDHSLWFMNQGLNVTSIDLSLKMAEIAREKGVDVKIMDMENINFKEDSFEGIWAVTSLLHLKKNKVSNVISSFSRVLKKDGILFVVLKEGNGEGLQIDEQNSLTKRYFSYWHEEELLKVLEKNFNLIEFWKDKPRNTTYLQYLLRNKK